METRELAERVLFGRTLEEKLSYPAIVTDDRPGVAIARPESPHRPAALSLARRARARFPSIAQDLGLGGSPSRRRGCSPPGC